MKKYLLGSLLLLFGAIISNAQSDGSLGIRLSSFNASKHAASIKLQWTVACFISYANFDIQRSVDGIHFTSIHQFQADYLRCRQPFDYTDATASGQQFYRLKVGGLNGNFSSEKIIRIHAEEPTGTTITVNNAIKGDFLELLLSTESDEKILLQVVNMQGAVIKSGFVQPGKGISSVEWPIALPSAGLYFLRYTTVGKIKLVRFFKTN